MGQVSSVPSLWVVPITVVTSALTQISKTAFEELYHLCSELPAQIFEAPRLVQN